MLDPETPDTPDATPERLENIKETSRWSGLPVSYLYTQTAANKMPHFKVGKYLRFRRSEVEQWLQSKRKGPRSAGAAR